MSQAYLRQQADMSHLCALALAAPDGQYLRHDHSISIDGDEYRDKIWLYSWVFVGVYPLGIPLFLLFCLWFAGVPGLVKTKLEQARFSALLNFRNRQLNSMTRSLCVFAVGHSMDDEEFERRVKHIYDTGESA